MRILTMVTLLSGPGMVTGEQEGGSPNHLFSDYLSSRPKTIIELQPFRKETTTTFQTADGKLARATLINLNPNVSVWYLLQIEVNGEKTKRQYHIENPFAHYQQIRLGDANNRLLVIEQNDRFTSCEIWSSDTTSALDKAKRYQKVYAPICQNYLFVRNPTQGHRTALEATTDFLRDNVPGGEKIVGFVRDNFFKDAHRLEARSHADPKSETDITSKGPASAHVGVRYSNQRIVPPELGIKLEDSPVKGLVPGLWYNVHDNPGIYISVIRPDMIDHKILQGHLQRVNSLDKVEASSMVYLVGFDMERHTLGFALGTRHPGVGWSPRVSEKIRNDQLPGPDGIEGITPLVTTGLIHPLDAVRTVATFTGGFKRRHGAFKYGELSQKNSGSHYGFMENGVIFSKLQPGLATLWVDITGKVHMETWTESGPELLSRIKHARQNGVPIIEGHDDSQKPVPGRFVNRWGAGNWSGSSEGKLRALRAGIALQKNKGKSFLIYAYFSTTTPSAMARVFQAYDCRYAMHLDMNALEHTYLAVYRRSEVKFAVQHLIKEMSVLDKTDANHVIPRFLGFPDNRDFFYLMRKK